MANKKAKAVEEIIEDVKPVVKDDTEAIKRENDDLKSQLDELKAQMSLMAEMMAMKNSAPTATKSNKQITFINMSRGTAVLRGSVMWKIKGQFNKRDFTETEASIIVANMSNAIRNGVVYIADSEFIESHNLTEVYKHILSDKQLESLFKTDVNTVVEMYKMANDYQREVIVDMITAKKTAGMPVDANIVVEISKLCGKNLMEIEPEEKDEK